MEHAAAGAPEFGEPKVYLADRRWPDWARMLKASLGLSEGTQRPRYVTLERNCVRLALENGEALYAIVGEGDYGRDVLLRKVSASVEVASWQQ
jgi:hypothetical protein